MIEPNMVFEFGSPWYFVLLVAPFFVFWVLPPFKKRKSALISPLFFQAKQITGQDAQSSAWISRRNVFQWITLILAWIGFVTAMSSPQLVGQPEMKIKTARSFLIAADLSFSMDTKDWQVGEQKLSRWEAVQSMLKDFMETRKSDRVGLIFFATNPYLQAPLTLDHDVIRWMLGETEVGMAGQTTGIGAAIGMGIKVLKADTLERKVMLLITDGVDSGKDISPLDAANLAKVDSIQIYTLGIGDPKGSSADLDEKSLKQIAEVTGGQYFNALDQAQLELAYEALDELEPVEFEVEEYRPKVLLYYYPLGLGLILVMISQFISAIVNYRKSTSA